MNFQQHLEFIALPIGLHNWPHVVVSAVFSKRECSYTWGKFLQAMTEKERDKLKKGGKKPLSHLASCLKKKKEVGGDIFYTATVR